MIGKVVLNEPLVPIRNVREVKPAGKDRRQKEQSPFKRDGGLEDEEGETRSGLEKGIQETSMIDLSSKDREAMEKGEKAPIPGLRIDIRV